MIRTRSPSGSAAAMRSAESAAAGRRSRTRSTTRWPDEPIGSGSGSSARPARWSASSRLAASTSTSGMPPPAVTSSRRTTALLTPASLRMASATSSATASSTMTGPVSVWASEPGAASRHDREPLELEAAGDVRQRAPRRQIDPWQVVDEHDDRHILGGVDEQVTRRKGDRERLHRLLHALQRQGGAHRQGAGRGQPVDAIEHPVEQPRQARPGQLDLGLDPAQPADSPCRLIRHDQLGGLIENGGLADPRLPDDRQRAALAKAARPARPTIASTTSCRPRERRWSVVGRRHGFFMAEHARARGLPDAGATVTGAHYRSATVLYP